MWNILWHSFCYPPGESESSIPIWPTTVRHWYEVEFSPPAQVRLVSKWQKWRQQYRAQVNDEQFAALNLSLPLSVAHTHTHITTAQGQWACGCDAGHGTLNLFTRNNRLIKVKFMVIAFSVWRRAVRSTEEHQHKYVLISFSDGLNGRTCGELWNVIERERADFNEDIYSRDYLAYFHVAEHHVKNSNNANRWRICWLTA